MKQLEIVKKSKVQLSCKSSLKEDLSLNTLKTVLLMRVSAERSFRIWCRRSSKSMIKVFFMVTWNLKTFSLIPSLKSNYLLYNSTYSYQMHKATVLSKLVWALPSIWLLSYGNVILTGLKSLMCSHWVSSLMCSLWVSSYS